MITYKLGILLWVFAFMLSGCVHNCPKEVMSPFHNKELGPAVLAPDNQAIIFSLFTGPDVQLYRVRVDGTGLDPITYKPTVDLSPAISPDGTKVAYVHLSNGQGDICVINIDGRDNKCLTFGLEHDYSPVFSPDGRKIYFLRAETFKNYSPIARPGWHDVDIYSINSDGTDLTRITRDKNYFLSDLSVNRDGEILMVLTSTREMEKGPLLLIPIKDPGRKKIVRPNLDKYRKKFLFWNIDIDYTKLRNPHFSPDGERIIFTWPYYEELFVMDLNNSQSERIWKWEGEEKRRAGRMYPRYSRDGRQISFSTVTRVDADICISENIARGQSYVSNLWLINADGTGLRAVDVK